MRDSEAGTRFRLPNEVLSVERYSLPPLHSFLLCVLAPSTVSPPTRGITPLESGAYAQNTQIIRLV